MHTKSHLTLFRTAVTCLFAQSSAGFHSRPAVGEGDFGRFAAAAAAGQDDFGAGALNDGPGGLMVAPPGK